MDRVRQEVATRQLNPQRVLILFFERQGVETRVHPIELDRKGNLLNAPPSYRQFFLDEQMNLLTRGNT